MTLNLFDVFENTVEALTETIEYQFCTLLTICRDHLFDKISIGHFQTLLVCDFSITTAEILKKQSMPTQNTRKILHMRQILLHFDERGEKFHGSSLTFGTVLFPHHHRIRTCGHLFGVRVRVGLWRSLEKVKTLDRDLSDVIET